MRKLNLIVVFNKDLSKGLFCIRAKDPYKWKYNFVGGKIEKVWNLTVYLKRSFFTLFYF